jgi:hypothetical protein
MLDVSSLVSFARDQEQTNNFYALIGEAIKLALQPWDPGKSSVFLSDYLAAPRTIVIEVELLPKWPFAFKIDPFDQLTHDPECLAWKVADEAYLWFLNRPLQPVEDHIILGEN